MSQMDVDACPSALHGHMTIAVGRDVERALDQVMADVAEEVKTSTLRLHSRLAEFNRNPNHVTVLGVTVHVIDQDATALTYEEVVQKTDARMVRLLQYARYQFERIRRILAAVRN